MREKRPKPLESVQFKQLCPSPEKQLAAAFILLRTGRSAGQLHLESDELTTVWIIIFLKPIGVGQAGSILVRMSEYRGQKCIVVGHAIRSPRRDFVL